MYPFGSYSWDVPYEVVTALACVPMLAYYLWAAIPWYFRNSYFFAIRRDWRVLDKVTGQNMVCRTHSSFALGGGDYYEFSTQERRYIFSLGKTQECWTWHVYRSPAGSWYLGVAVFINIGGVEKYLAENPV